MAKLPQPILFSPSYRAGQPSLVGPFFFLLIFLPGLAAPAWSAEHWYDTIDNAISDTTSSIYTELEEPAGVGSDWYVGRVARALIMGLTPHVVLPDVNLPYVRIGDLVRSTTAFYSAEIVNGTTKWVELGGLSIYRDQGDYAFRVKIAEASNYQEIQVPLPVGYAIKELKVFHIGINQPIRNVTVAATNGMDKDRVIVWQPYSWYDTNMEAWGIVSLMGVWSGVVPRDPPPKDGLSHTLNDDWTKSLWWLQERRPIWR